MSRSSTNSQSEHWPLLVVYTTPQKVEHRVAWQWYHQIVRHQKDDGGDAGHHHHDQQPAVQVAFLKDVRALVTVFEEMGNPFLERS